MKIPNLEELDRSPLFAASLGSKELFHSNFLGFLIKKKPSLAFKLFGVELGDSPEVEREQNHADLIMRGGGNVLVVENKVKDVAKPKQLAEIEARIKDGTHFILLSFLGENVSKNDLGKWKEVSYQTLVNGLSEYDFSDEYLGLLVKDYLCFVCILLRELDELKQCESYCFYRTKNEAMDIWRKYRLHDLYMKYGLSRFAAYARKAFADSGVVSVETYINNSKPTISFKVETDTRIACVQIEDNQYRRAIIGKEEDLSVFESVGWFRSEYESAQGKKYLRYAEPDGLCFYYQIMDFEIVNKSFFSLLEIVAEDLKKIAPNIHLVQSDNNVPKLHVN